MKMLRYEASHCVFLASLICTVGGGSIVYWKLQTGARLSCAIDCARGFDAPIVSAHYLLTATAHCLLMCRWLGLFSYPILGRARPMWSLAHHPHAAPSYPHLLEPAAADGATKLQDLWLFNLQ